LTPHATLAALQDSEQFTKLMVLQEELKTMPMGAVWEEFCARQGVEANEGWFDAVAAYENDVLLKRV
jgi:L-rhamnose isomerase